MNDKLDIATDLQEQQNEAWRKACDENNKLLELEAKCNIPNVVQAVLESDNMRKVEELIEYFRSIRLVPYTMLFLFHKQQEVKGGAKLNPKEHEIDYSSFTDEAIAEMHTQKKKCDEAFKLNYIAEDKARKAWEEYKEEKKMKNNH